MAQIPGDIPGLTVHDVSHLDALWSMASMIAGEDYLNPKNFTPAEAFVLGGAILLHDAAMSLAAYPNGMEGLRLTDQWRDMMARLKADGVAEAEIDKQALPAVLRVRHAIQAQAIATAGWKAEGGDEYLIDDGELREFYGEIIGQIAHSHWWPVSRLEGELGEPLNAARRLPDDWTVDPVKVAGLLRVADAAHLSSDRAPRFLMAITRPTGESARHWTFQTKLAQPRVKSDRLTYTSSGAGFTLEHADAWWLCHESLSMVQEELRAVDILLADTNRPRLQAREVEGAGSPERLAKLVRVKGWQPVDARVTISDVPALVRTLGGAQLYGDDPTVPLRELMQNACDAIRARRILQKKPESWGTITVRFDETAEGTWLEVLDDGIGMSPRVMTGPLLDFGKSFWRSSMAAEEFPGLAAAGMEATGRFGIGFYSVFMLGDRVTVTSRRYDAGFDQARTLEFRGGVEMRPILRAPTESERMEEPGTRVRVLLAKRPDEQGGILCCAKSWGGSEIADPATLLAYLAPAIDANLNFSKDGLTNVCVRANDWITLDGDKLLERIFSKSRKPLSHERKALEQCAKSLRLLTDDRGKIYGRGCVSVDRSFGIVAVGGYYAEQVSGISGIFLGATDMATRNVANLLTPADILSRWSSEQANIISSLLQEDPDENPVGIIAGCGGDISGLKFIKNRGVNLNKEQFIEEIKGLDKIYLCDDGDLSYDSDADDVIEREFESGFIANTDAFFIYRRKSPRYGSIFTGRSVYSYNSPCPFKELFMKALKEVWKDFQVEDDFECIGSVDDIEIRRYAAVYSRLR
ncbi:HD domain-containing protein [Azospirillum sp. B2RO_4]|uniref:HD domain-containing protein n=1 Tax=Azospirillum sp. B2RO_4 TaxID=3027796 RepID=UPI003DA7C1BC